MSKLRKSGRSGRLLKRVRQRHVKSITVLPSSHVIDGQRVSRIVPALPEAAVVTVPRTLVDYVVTEHGIASMRGKSIRERIGELIAVAHPDFRAELRAEAKRLHNVAV